MKEQSLEEKKENSMVYQVTLNVAAVDSLPRHGPHARALTKGIQQDKTA